MIIGEDFPIRINAVAIPPILLDEGKTAIVVSNNNVVKFTYKKGVDGLELVVENDVNGVPAIAFAKITREQSLQLNAGQIEIELIAQIDDDDFPQGKVTIAKFIEPVSKTNTTEVEW